MEEIIPAIPQVNKEIKSSENMELDVHFSSLKIKERKRRLSGYVDVESVLTENGDGIEFQPRRSTRKKIRTLETENRRVIQKPKKLEGDDLIDIKKLYLDKSIKRLTTSLETIYEEPQKSKQNKNVYISSKKFRRTITFHDISASTISSKLKVKKRSLKAKKVKAGSGRTNTRKKISLDCLIKTLNLLSDTEEDDIK